MTASAPVKAAPAQQPTPTQSAKPTEPIPFRTFLLTATDAEKKELLEKLKIKYQEAHDSNSFNLSDKIRQRMNEVEKSITQLHTFTPPNKEEMIRRNGSQ